MDIKGNKDDKVVMYGMVMTREEAFQKYGGLMIIKNIAEKYNYEITEKTAFSIGFLSDVLSRLDYIIEKQREITGMSIKEINNL